MRAFILFIVLISWLEANTVKDYDTSLMWQDNYDAKTILRDWQGAKKYCQELILAGYSDWRLPIIKELQSIVDITRHDSASKKIFKNVASERYWSASEDVLSTKFAWRVDFDSGNNDVSIKSFSLFVRCVRGRQ